MSNPNALFLLADHLKLSLLERQRAQALNQDGDSQVGHISRSLDQFREGLEALEKEQKRLEEAGDETKALDISDSLPALKKQFDDLTSQFHGFSSPTTSATLTHPNDPTLASDFAHAASTDPNTANSASTASLSAAGRPSKTSLRSPSGGAAKTVRFQDSPAGGNRAAAVDPEHEAAAAALFGRGGPEQPYRDDPDAPQGYRDQTERLETNAQIHSYHSRVLEEQDAQLDTLGESIGRQRELSMQIGDELDDHVAMLEEAEMLTDRHQSRLDRARRSLGRFARAAGESKQMVAIVVLIVILVLLIAVLK